MHISANMSRHQPRPRRLLALAHALDALLDDPDADADDIAVFVALARHTDAEGYCHPSQSTIAKRLRRSRPWVNARIARLATAGRIEKARRRQAKGGETSCRYRLPALAPCQQDDTPCHQRDTNQDSHQEIKESLSGTGPVVIPIEVDEAPAHPLILLPDDWRPSVADLAWAKGHRPDVPLASFTGKFIAKANAAGGLRRDPSVKWREWLSAEWMAPPRPSSTALARGRGRGAQQGGSPGQPAVARATSSHQGLAAENAAKAGAALRLIQGRMGEGMVQ